MCHTCDSVMYSSTSWLMHMQRSWRLGTIWRLRRLGLMRTCGAIGANCSHWRRISSTPSAVGTLGARRQAGCRPRSTTLFSGRTPWPAWDLVLVRVSTMGKDTASWLPYTNKDPSLSYALPIHAHKLCVSLNHVHTFCLVCIDSGNKDFWFELVCFCFGNVINTDEVVVTLVGVTFFHLTAYLLFQFPYKYNG